jgi:hypothetical protein
MSIDEESEEAKKLDHKIDYLDRIEKLEEELKNMTDQAAKFRDLAQSQASLLDRAAEALKTAREGGSMHTVYYGSLIAELHEAAKDE